MLACGGGVGVMKLDEAATPLSEINRTVRESSIVKTSTRVVILLPETNRTQTFPALDFRAALVLTRVDCSAG
jgi:hypothetical protein